MSLKNKIIVLLILISSTFLVSQTFTFTPAGATGRYGPTQTQVSNTYSNTTLNGLVTAINGIQNWTVPATGAYKIEAYGAKGGNGWATIAGSGAKMQGEFSLTAGQVLKIVVGQVGNNGLVGGGGGGSFVSDNSNVALIVAGGAGGGAWQNMYSFGLSNNTGTIGTSGMPGSNGNTSVTASTGGTAGAGGSAATTYTIGQGSGGGGFAGNGANGNPSTGGLAFTNGGNGGAGTVIGTDIGGDGGFGGGGGGDWSNNTGAGGGGGYSGGGGGTYFGLGGGGGSYNSGINQINTSGVNAGNGYVVFTKISGLNIVQTVSISCYGQTTAVLTASAFGGTAPYSYSWSPSGGTGATSSGLGIGTYTCRAIDAASVMYTNTFVITQPSLMLGTISQTNVSCFGGSNGIANINVTGGVFPYSYTWTPGNFLGSTFNSLSAGNYSCLVKDANGCTSSATATIIQPAALTVFGIASNPTVCSGGTSVLLGGGALTYSWSNGVTNAVAFTPTVTQNYTLTGMDAAGCTATAVTGIVVNASPTLNIAGSNTLCSGNSVVLTVSGANSYTWDNTSNTTTISVSPTITTNYSVTGSNANGCQQMSVKTVSVINSTVVNANATSPAVCNGNTVSLYGSGAVTYTWTGGITNNTPFTATLSDTYTVTGTGACGTASATIVLTVNALPSVIANASSTLVCSGSTVSLYGLGANTYTWSGDVSNNVAFPLSANATYTLTGTDANGCQNTAVKSISINPLPVVTGSVSASVVCAGSLVVFNGGGASTYVWTGGVTNNSPFAPATSATYTVTGTDGNGCKNTATTSVAVIIVPIITANSTSLSVCNGNTITLFGGGALSYTWSGAVINNASFTPSLTSTYTVYGSNSCFTASNVITVTVNTLPLVVANTTNSVICSGSTLTLYGSGALTYTWSGGVTNNASFPPAASVVYTVTGTDVNGCKGTATRAITVNALPIVTASASSLVLCQGNTLTLNGAGAQTYTWSGTVTNGASFTPILTQTYTVTGTDANGCQNTAVKTVTVNPLPTVSVVASNSVICIGAFVTLSGVNADLYNWSGGITNGLPFSPNSTSLYTVTGTYTLTGCTNTAVQGVTVNSLPSLTITASSSVVCNGQFVTLNATGANTYSWTSGVLNNTPFFPSSTLNYSVVGTNTVTGCKDSTAMLISVNPLPFVTAVVSSSAICFGNSTSLSGQGASTYTWSGGVLNGNSFSPSVTTTYSVSGTNTITGCTSTNAAVQTVTVHALPSVLASTSATLICAGETAILTATGAQSYIWSTGETTSPINVSPIVTTSYTLSGMDANGCSNTTTLRQDVSDCLGINKQNTQLLALTVFPNPNNGEFFLSTDQDIILDVVNELGQIVKVISLDESNKKNYRVSDLPNGIYFILGQTHGTLVKQKVIVSK